MYKRYLLIFFSAVILAVLGFAAVNFYQANFYDSSSNGSEVKEQQQNSIPKDVETFLHIDQRLHPKSETSQLPQSVRVPVLMYHYVEYVADKGDKTRISLNTTPFTLEQEVKTLSAAGYHFMTAGELGQVLNGQMQLPDKPIVLTFDDGYRDFYTDAYPILKKYHVKATQYVISGFLNASNHLTTAQLLEIAQDGLVEIGAHTAHHTWLKGQSLKKVNAEVLQSKTFLEKLTHKPVVSFAYPFGAFDQQAVEVVQKSGFSNAVSTVPGIKQQWAQRYFLYRLRPGGRVGKLLLEWLNQLE